MGDLTMAKTETAWYELIGQQSAASINLLVKCDHFANAAAVNEFADVEIRCEVPMTKLAYRIQDREGNACKEGCYEFPSEGVQAFCLKDVLPLDEIRQYETEAADYALETTVSLISGNEVGGTHAFRCHLRSGKTTESLPCGDLKAQLAEEANLTEEAKKAMNDTIISLEQQKWNKLAEITDKEMKAAVDAETRDAQERSKKAEQMAKQQNETLKKRKDLYDILGFKLTDDQKKGIDEALGYAIGSLNQFMDAYVAAAEARRQEADNEVERTQRVLEAEIEARNAGYANDVETARKELEEAKKNQQKAIEQQKRAQQAQELIDTATQTSSLITATANIWKSLSGIPIVGTALAIAAIATMWGSFAAAKIMAHQVAGSSTESYGEGTVELLQGGSHQSGNDIDLGRKKDGTRRRAEGGEYFAVINKKSSRKYGNLIPDIINSLNRDTFAEKYMGAYDGAGVSVTVNGRNPDLKELTQSVNDIRDQGRTRTYVDGGNTVMVYKNLKRVVRNGN